MKTPWKKYAAIALFLTVATSSFAEEIYRLGAGLNFFTDQFPDDNYSRSQIGEHLMGSVYIFPKDSFLGLFAKLSLGASTSTTEQNAREEMEARDSDIFNLRMALAPSFRLKLGSNSNFQIPFSLGPSFVFTSEKTPGHFLYQWYYMGAKKYYYQSVTGGINADIAVLVTPDRHFYVWGGIFCDYYFLRAEHGEMRMNYRATHNRYFTGVPYSTFNVGVNIGVGLGSIKAAP